MYIFVHLQLSLYLSKHLEPFLTKVLLFYIYLYNGFNRDISLKKNYNNNKILSNILLMLFGMYVRFLKILHATG